MKEHARPRRRKAPKDYSWLVVEPQPEPTPEELERIRREDEDIKRRREAFPLH